jgi:lysozyme
MSFDLIPPTEELASVAADLLAFLEGERLRPYQDQAGVWTIGNGETVLDGKPVTADTPPLSPIQAREDLIADILLRIEFLRTDLSNAKAEEQFTLAQAAALVSFIYNVGESAFNSSTMRRDILLNLRESAAFEFPRWNLVAGQPNLGVLRRRRREQVLFMDLYSVDEILSGVFNPDSILNLKTLPTRETSPLGEEAVTKLLNNEEL